MFPHDTHTPRPLGPHLRPCPYRYTWEPGPPWSRGFPLTLPHRSWLPGLLSVCGPPKGYLDSDSETEGGRDNKTDDEGGKKSLRRNREVSDDKQGGEDWRGIGSHVGDPRVWEVGRELGSRTEPGHKRVGARDQQQHGRWTTQETEGG